MVTGIASGALGKGVSKLAGKLAPKISNIISAFKSSKFASGLKTALADEGGYVKLGAVSELPEQMHHFLTNKSRTFTSQFDSITKKYGLDLNEAWNKDILPHIGRHPNEYHRYMLEELKEIDKIAKGDKDLFIRLFQRLKQKVMNNPEMLQKVYWRGR